jgi:hypothetical protein
MKHKRISFSQLVLSFSFPIEIFLSLETAAQAEMKNLSARKKSNQQIQNVKKGQAQRLNGSTY